MTVEIDDISVILDSLEKLTEEAVRDIVIETAAGIMEEMPRDTGWAASNVLPSITDPIDEPVGTPENIDNAAAAAATTKILGYTLVDGKAFVNIPVPYAGRLNAGSSPQAPAGFIEDNILKALTKAEGLTIG